MPGAPYPYPQTYALHQAESRPTSLPSVGICLHVWLRTPCIRIHTGSWGPAPMCGMGGAGCTVHLVYLDNLPDAIVLLCCCPVRCCVAELVPHFNPKALRTVPSEEADKMDVDKFVVIRLC